MTGPTSVARRGRYFNPITGWADATEDAKLVSSTLAEDDEFGTAVAMSSSLVNVGARFFATGGYSNAGAAYLFGGAMDCNNTQEIDICEIESGSSPDENGNGLLDECEDPNAVPDTFAKLILHQNRPNHFNPSTEIGYYVSTGGEGALRIFDLHGKSVRILRQGRFAVGTGSVIWNGRDDEGRQWYVRLSPEHRQPGTGSEHGDVEVVDFSFTDNGWNIPA